MSATLQDETRLQTQQDLRFKMGQFWDVKLPIDRTDLKYWPRFLTSSTGGTTFPDLAWTIPVIANSASDLVPTLFACRTINKVINVRNWLVSELQQVLPKSEAKNRELAKKLVLPFHAEMDSIDWRETLGALASRSAPWIVATILANVGIDIAVTNVICIDMPDSVEDMVQWAGRASRDGSGGLLVVYASEEMEYIPEAERDLSTYGTKLTKVKIEQHEQFQASCQPVMVHFFNPRINKCHCTVLCQYFGDQFMLPEACCKKCDPELLRSHIEAVGVYLHTHPKMIKETLTPFLPCSNPQQLPTQPTQVALQKLLVWQH